MIEIGQLTKRDVGRWVIYQPGYGPHERGKIKSWNAMFVFVVYKCDGKWDEYENYTGCATKPEDLTIMHARGESDGIRD